LIPPAAPPAPPGPRPWWEGRPFVAAMILLSAVPFLYPPIPPITDLIGHMGRYRVELDLASSPSLQRYYSFHWAMIGNLGVDLLIIPMAKVFGLELGVKLIVLAIPPLTVAGFLWVAREVHHRLPPTALFALPFALSHPFLFGFVNFALSMALAFLAFGLWLRLGRLGKTRLRAVLFVPISVAVFITHTFGWGTLGLLAFSAEAVRQHDRGRSWWNSGFRATLHAATMALPLVMMLAWRSDMPSGTTADLFNWALKIEWLAMALRDRWHWVDVASVGIALLMVLVALAHPRLTMSRNLAFSALVLTAAYVLMPRIIFGSAYADMRLAPFLFVVMLLAIRFRDDTHLRTARVLAWSGLAFVLMRIAATSLSLGIAANDQSAKLAALDHVPIGARVISLVGRRCDEYWKMPRNDHLGSMVIVRRYGFSNDQWAIEGANLLLVHYAKAGHFIADPSQIVRPARCSDQERWAVDRALAAIPRDAIDYIWTIDLPPHDQRLLAGYVPIWRGPGSLLYAKRPPRAKEVQ
jgi:hypothetical protein